MITQQNVFGIIKIADFGLSQILSTTESTVDGSGTLDYAAPEILTRTPYNKEVDIWAMGVILYRILCGIFPFKGKDNKDLASKIVYEELKFDKNYWENRSKNVQDLIKNCLDKSQESRIKIDDFINHPWFKKNRTKKLSL